MENDISGGLTSAELVQLKAKAETMSLDELVEYALKALSELKVEEEVAATG